MPLTDEESLRRFGVPASAVNGQLPEHAQRIYRGLTLTRASPTAVRSTRYLH